MKASIFYLAAIVLTWAGIMLHGRAVRDEKTLKDYDAMKGAVLKRKTAVFGGNHYAWMMEYKVGAEYLGVKCYFPRFAFIAPYSEINLAKSRALIGHLVSVRVPQYPNGFDIHPSLAKKLEELSGGRFGYSKILV